MRICGMALSRKPQRRTLTPEEKSAANLLYSKWMKFRGRPGYESQQALAERAPEGWNQSTISKHLNGEVALTLEAVDFYCKEFKIIDPFLIAAGPVANQLQRAEATIARPRLNPDEFIMVPLFDAELSGGNGFENHKETYTPIAFRRDFARAQGVDESALIAFKVRGDSMAEQIRDGDAVIGRTDRLGNPTNGVYGLTLNGDELVKRISFNQDGSVLLISDNQNDGPISPVYIPVGERDLLTLLGEIFHRSGKII